MAWEHIHKLQQEYVDKYVVVDEHRPELRRFQGLTGVVKTINMNGDALVQFDGYNNIAWYDIDVDYLRVVDPPAPKAPAAKAAAAKASAPKTPAPKAATPKEEAPKEDAPQPPATQAGSDSAAPPREPSA